MDKFSVLQQYFGHSSFRPGQEQVVDAIVSGQDVWRGTIKFYTLPRNAC